VSFILHPRAVVEMDKQASSRTQASVGNDRIDALTFLSDLSSLFEHSSHTPTLAKKQYSHVLRKLTFYAAQVAMCPTSVLRTLAVDLHHQATCMEATEQGETEIVRERGITLPFSPAAGEVDVGIVSGPGPARRKSPPAIEELS
jgi:hypothetical protein